MMGLMPAMKRAMVEVRTMIGRIFENKETRKLKMLVRLLYTRVLGFVKVCVKWPKLKRSEKFFKTAITYK